MKHWRLWIILLLVLILATLSIYAWLAAPRVIGFAPATDASEVPVRSPIQLTFSHTMRREMVESRLTTDPPRTGTFSWDANILTFTPDLPWPGGSQVTVLLDAGSRAQDSLGLPLWQAHTWMFTTAQALLAYLWPSDAPSDLYILDPLSGEVRRLTVDANIQEYSISPDGRTIYFSAPNAQSGVDLFRLDFLSAAANSQASVAPVLLLACPNLACTSPQPSPDGKWLAYVQVELTQQAQAQVWLLDLATLDSTPIDQAGHTTENPAWSSSNFLAYYDRQLAGYVIRDFAADRTFIAPNSTGEPGVWALDGSAYIAPEIIYVQSGSDQLTLGSSRLIRYTPFGPSQDLTMAENVEDTTPAISPVDATIAFARKYLDEPRWSFGRQLWLMSPDGSQAHQITHDDLYNHFDFAWSWDGQWLAYVRFENASYSQELELWMRDADGSHPIQLNIGGYSPQWIP